VALWHLELRLDVIGEVLAADDEEVEEFAANFLVWGQFDETVLAGVYGQQLQWANEILNILHFVASKCHKALKFSPKF
jgi:hypothetical protein